MSATDITRPLNWPDTVIFRHLRQEDLPALEWEGEFTHFRNMYAQAYDRAQRGLSVIWVAELPCTGIIGQVFLQLDCDRPELANGQTRAYLYSFRIKTAFQNHGIGTRMMHHVERDLIQRGYQSITLNVAKDNFRAQVLYRRLGYRIVAHEPGIWSYFDDQGILRDMEEPAWRMEKRLIPAPRTRKS